MTGRERDFRSSDEVASLPTVRYTRQIADRISTTLSTLFQIRCHDHGS